MACIYFNKILQNQLTALLKQTTRLTARNFVSTQSFPPTAPRAKFAQLRPRGRPVPEEFPPYKLQIQSAPRYIERTPNVAGPWQNIGPTCIRTRIRVSTPAAGRRWVRVSVLYGYIYCIYIHVCVSRTYT